MIKKLALRCLISAVQSLLKGIKDKTSNKIDDVIYEGVNAELEKVKKAIK